MIKGDYVLKINLDNQEYQGYEEVEIGKVVFLPTGEDLFYIMYDKNLYSTAGYHLCMYTYVDGLPCVFVDDNYRECLYNKIEIFFVLAMHEYGHYINGDLARTDVTNQSIQDERTACILNGKVQEIELKADEFAVKCAGKNTFMRAMDYCIAQRKKRADKDMHLAIKEFELRKKAAQKIK